MTHSSASDFEPRHVGPDDKEVGTMLRALHLNSLDHLVGDTIPKSIMLDGDFKLDAGLDEAELLALARKYAQENIVARNFIGQGYYGTITPNVIRRCILENPNWYTAYTPYQAEISQGRMEALLNFQTMVCDLSGMDIANASLLDEATAAAEAMSMALAAQSKNTSRVFFVDREAWPQTLDVIRTRAKFLNIEVVVGSADELLKSPQSSLFGAYLQTPGASGRMLADLRPYAKAIHDAGGLCIIGSDPLALCVTASPGSQGADIVVGSSQRFGVPMMFGGPHAAYLATKEDYKRSVPGRFIGVSIDAGGHRALRMALQTREQHIRREKATSNICTSQVLLAVMASMYAVYHGPAGLQRIARRVHRLARSFETQLRYAGFTPAASLYFDTVRIETGVAKELAKACRSRGINIHEEEKAVQVTFDETHGESDIADLIQVFSEFGTPTAKTSTGVISDEAALADWPQTLGRHTALLNFEAFQSHHTETKMMRYITFLERKDLTLTHAMIPLGSCTMKLNAATELTPVTWPEFANLHPFAPMSQTTGYQKLIGDLCQDLCEITGFHAVSLQPNAGSQGEYAGLLVIRSYFEAKGQGKRQVCLIPQSAHGTNPASAAMAGMKIVIVKCDDAGNVDVNDLKTKAEKHKDELCALMITYPSTHGVFEESIRDICGTIHQFGGKVYLDGANMNALVGLCRPGDFGADVCHLNLHKTFSIPHGGGGPGIGPIGVSKELAPFLPGHVYHHSQWQAQATTAVSAAPFGSAGILPISWGYIKMMGGSGLKRASQVAILNANYVAKRLSGAFPILYKGQKGHVAHECIIDVRAFKKTAEIEPDDIAKRLMDYGFHAPTMSWPVPGTLMIEPTESESLDELDRFCDAMLSIRKEIENVENGTWPKDNNPLSHAPHTAAVVSQDKWERPYTRETAAYPIAWLRVNKYWPTVSRIDGSYGDRNFVCSCPPLSDYND